jgi:retron-type reverse transcriptase
MYEKTLSQIITLKTLKNSYALISKKSIGLDQVSVELFEEDLNSNLQDIVDDILKNRYTPEPLSRIYIPKQNSTEFRPLGLGALKDKIVQKALSLELSSYFEKEFSDSSYGYRTI